MSDKKKEMVVKVVLLGNVGVGKSSLAVRFAYDDFHDSTESTIGASFLTRNVAAPQGKDYNTVRFDIWDTAGQERYRCMLPMYYKNAAAAIIVMNVTEPQSFEGAKSWAEELQEKCSTAGLVKVLAVNKCDLPNKMMLESGEIKAYAESNGLLYYEVSAKTGLNVATMFEKIATELPEVLPSADSDSRPLANSKIFFEERENNTGGKCC